MLTRPADTLLREFHGPTQMTLCPCGQMIDTLDAIRVWDHRLCRSGSNRPLPQTYAGGRGLLNTLLHIQDGLRRGKLTLKALQEPPFALDIKIHPKFPTLVMFKYNMLESVMSLPLVQQCRGIILDAGENWRTVARPFDKFWNIGEALASPIDWRTASVYEKLDGSLMIMYWYRGAWQVASSGTPDAGGTVDGQDFTFADLFWSTWSAKGYQFPMKTWEANTFMFELTSPYNRIVVRHAEPNLRLIGVRANYSGIEMPISLCGNFKYDVVRQFGRLKSHDELTASFEAMNPLEQEGYVAVDSQQNRVKIKHPGYVDLHHMRGNGFGPKRILSIILRGEASEVLGYFPEWKADFAKVQNAYDNLEAEILTAYGRHAAIEVQKDFALAVIGYPFSGVLFALRSKKVASVADAFEEMHIDRLLLLLRLQDIETEGV